jgi:hypothetical protein
MNLHVGLAGALQQNLEVVNPIDPILVVVDLDVFEEIQAELPLPPLPWSLAQAVCRARIIPLQTFECILA